ncbi:MAG: hypothetical protein P9C25_10955 [Defluviicoccus sp.]|nr:hypothetical protein [Defluviicoccus sp.]
MPDPAADAGRGAAGGRPGLPGIRPAAGDPQRQRPAVAAEQNGSAFVADTAQAWRDVLCIQEERVVGNDNTVKWKRLSLQIPPSPLRPHFVRAKVRVLEYPDGRLAVFWGPHRLADYDALGNITNAHALAA